LANVQLSTDLKWPAVPADLAIKIALEGATAVKDPRLPWAHFGAMTAFDPLEIDGLRSLQDLLDGYLRSEEVRPLSIAVFGPPGSGKSYGVKQIAETRKHLLAKRQHTFNLSQFSDSNMLVDALHQVRDDALTGKPPLVFWDEFDTGSDSHRLVWLRYFLAPMQDGEFVEGQVTHRLGRAVFVFAGGTARTMSEFTAALNEEELKRAKLPDFVSRLRGFFDVPDSSIAAGDDPFPRLRRAIVLHELMTRAWPNLVKDKRVRMQPALVSAFLGVTKYRHGMRSLEAIIRSSQLHGKRHFAPSSLPARSQLALHVDADEFLGLVR
jgi:hypothetical protein